MNISDNFKQVIAETFYDKSVNIYDVVEIIGEELDAVRKKSTLKEKLKCNVHTIGNRLVKQEYGLDVEANLMITCNTTKALKGDIIVFNNQDYTIVEILIKDSHTKMFGKIGGI